MKFSEKVYGLCKKIPKGRVTTYGEIARALNCKSYRAVGNALRYNPYAPLVPCHRVVRSDGSLGGFKGKVNNEEKVNLLKREGIEINNGKVDLNKFLFQFC